MLVGVFDEVEDLHDRRVGHLGQELPLGHGDRLRLGVPGMHQALEHDRSFVDVVVDGEVHPAQSAVGDAALDLVLVGHHVARNQLGQERIGAAAVRAPSLGGRLRARRSTRPTGWPQFQQNRFDSATTGLTIRAASGSISGTRGISTSPPPRRRVGESLRATVAWCTSCGSVPTLPTESASSSSSKCGRKIAWVAIGRIVDTESMPRSSKLAGCVPTFTSGVSGVSISPDTSVSEAPAPVPAPSTTCGTTCSTCRRAGFAPRCR